MDCLKKFDKLDLFVYNSAMIEKERLLITEYIERICGISGQSFNELKL